MRYRTLGATDLRVSEMGFGCAGLGATFAPGGSRGGHAQLLRAALENGVNFFDTSDLYAQGGSERLIGEVMVRRRSEVVIATKGGYVMPVRRRALSSLKPLARPAVRLLRLRRSHVPRGISGTLTQDFTPEHIGRAVEGSLRRLRTDHIDLYQLHSPPASLIGTDEYVGALEELKAQGKLRYFGVAVDDDEDLRGPTSPAVHSIQAPFSLLHPEAGDDVFPRAAALGIGTLARSCFAAGLLGRNYTVEELKVHTIRWQEVLNLRSVARQLGRPLLEAALQFSLRGPASSTIIGMGSEDHLRTNLRHLAAPTLTRDELALLAAAVPRGTAPG